MFHPVSGPQKCFYVPTASHMTSVFLRSVRGHVYSQYLECVFDRWGKKVTRGSLFPRAKREGLLGNFLIWLKHFGNLGDDPAYTGEKYDYRCQDPRDTQTRYMSCVTKSNPNHALNPPPDLESALENLRVVDFLGLTDFYTESVCMIVYRRKGIIGPGCECQDPSEIIENGNNSSIVVREETKRGEQSNRMTNSSFQHAWITHNVPPHSVDDLTPEMDEIIYSITKRDQVFFLAGLERFVRDVKEVEEVSGKKIMCRWEKVEQLKEEATLLARFGEDVS